MDIRIVTDHITRDELRVMASQRYGDLVKAVVDVDAATMAVGGELHADEEAVMLEHESIQNNLWGINLYPEKEGEDFIEFDSMINIRPQLNNMSRSVESPELQEKIRRIVATLTHD